MGAHQQVPASSQLFLAAVPLVKILEDILRAMTQEMATAKGKSPLCNRPKLKLQACPEAPGVMRTKGPGYLLLTLPSVLGTSHPDKQGREGG